MNLMHHHGIKFPMLPNYSCSIKGFHDYMAVEHHAKNNHDDEDGE